MLATEHAHFVICIRNEGCEDLELRKLYKVLPDPSAERGGCLRIIDESGEDYLYPQDNFLDGDSSPRGGGGLGLGGG